MRDKRALLVIDMLNDFVDERGALYCGDGSRLIIKPVAERVSAFHEEGNPVFYVCDRHRREDPEFKMFKPHCLEGSWGAEVCAELAPSERDIVIPKRRYSAFFGTELELLLSEFGISDLTLVGVCTNICVLYTAADARMRNYEVLVPVECVASFDDEAHRFALNEMKNTLGVRLE